MICYSISKLMKRYQAHMRLLRRIQSEREKARLKQKRQEMITLPKTLLVKQQQQGEFVCRLLKRVLSLLCCNSNFMTCVRRNSQWYQQRIYNFIWKYWLYSLHNVFLSDEGIFSLFIYMYWCTYLLTTDLCKMDSWYITLLV